MYMEHIPTGGMVVHFVLEQIWGFFSILAIRLGFPTKSGLCCNLQGANNSNLRLHDNGYKNVYVAHSHWWNGCAFRRTRNLGIFPVFLPLDWVFREFLGYAVIYK